MVSRSAMVRARQICAVSLSRRSACVRASISRARSLEAARTAITSICRISVRLMFTVYLLPRTVGAWASVRRVQGAHERIREREEQREADADHRHRVEQARHKEHLYTQRRQQFRLAR